MDLLKRILRAQVYAVAKQTPVEKAPRLSKAIGNDLFLKREDMQPVFSFKIRGAYNKIAQLTFTFPKDATTSSGNLFWSPPKRFPEMIKFDPADAVHQAFAQAAAILVAQVYKVPVPEWAGDAGQVAAKAAVVEVAPFQPKSGMKINTDVNNNNAGADVDGSVLDTMKDTLAGAQLLVSISVRLGKQDNAASGRSQAGATTSPATARGAV